MTEELPANPLESIPPTGRIMGLDLGTKTIGVAISDGMRYSATPLETIKGFNFTPDAIRLEELFAQNHIAAIILGLPL
jgi:putative Holliday junction resolvase